MILNYIGKKRNFVCMKCNCSVHYGLKFKSQWECKYCQLKKKTEKLLKQH